MVYFLFWKAFSSIPFSLNEKHFEKTLISASFSSNSSLQGYKSDSHGLNRFSWLTKAILKLKLKCMAQSGSYMQRFQRYDWVYFRILPLFSVFINQNDLFINYTYLNQNDLFINYTLIYRLQLSLLSLVSNIYTVKCDSLLALGNHGQIIIGLLIEAWGGGFELGI